MNFFFWPSKWRRIDWSWDWKRIGIIQIDCRCISVRFIRIEPWVLRLRQNRNIEREEAFSDWCFMVSKKSTIRCMSTNVASHRLNYRNSYCTLSKYKHRLSETWQRQIRIDTLFEGMWCDKERWLIRCLSLFIGRPRDRCASRWNGWGCLMLSEMVTRLPGFGFKKSGL